MRKKCHWEHGYRNQEPKKSKVYGKTKRRGLKRGFYDRGVLLLTQSQNTRTSRMVTFIVRGSHHGEGVFAAPGSQSTPSVLWCYWEKDGKGQRSVRLS